MQEDLHTGRLSLYQGDPLRSLLTRSPHRDQGKPLGAAFLEAFIRIIVL